jgi:hypothetical protein
MTTVEPQPEPQPDPSPAFPDPGSGPEEDDETLNDPDNKDAAKAILESTTTDDT